MAEKQLTNYDRFLLKKMEEQKKATPVMDENPAYANYIISELRRTTPSERRVMTEEEFLQAENSTKPVVKGGKLAQVKNVASLKKMGFVFLIFYVIIVLALALIVVVNARNGSIIPGADASDVEEGVIQVLPADENEQPSGDWFDEFCDSLNK